MKTEVFPDADAVGSQAATFIVEEARAAVVARRRFVMAVSGGRAPWVMLRALASHLDASLQNLNLKLCCNVGLLI